MIYYKNSSGQVFAYETEAEREQYGAPSLVKMTTEEVAEHLNPAPPPLTYKEALHELNSVYQEEISRLNNSYALALLSDGPTEAAKLTAIRSQYEARKLLHASNISALKVEYGV